MKTKALIITILVMFSAMAAQAQENMFDKFSGNKEITTVVISKALLSMVPNMDAGGVDIKSLASKLDKLEIYTSENKSAIKAMKSEADKLAKNKSYEVLMSMKEKDQNVNFYAQQAGNNKFKELVMYVSEEENCTIIRIVGNFTMEDLQNLVKDADKK